MILPTQLVYNVTINVGLVLTPVISLVVPLAVILLEVLHLLVLAIVDM